MLTFEIDSSGEGLEIYLDSEGIGELIEYLKMIDSENDHMHLLIGNELDEVVINENNRLIKHVLLAKLV